jgi:hypothetical protein
VVQYEMLDWMTTHGIAALSTLSIPGFASAQWPTVSLHTPWLVCLSAPFSADSHVVMDENDFVDRMSNPNGAIESRRLLKSITRDKGVIAGRLTANRCVAAESATVPRLKECQHKG